MKSTKKILALLLSLILVFSLVACGNKNKGGDAGKTGNNGKAKKFGVLLFNGADPYIGTVRQALEALDKADDSFELDIQDSQNDQAKQNDQIDALVQKKVDALLINVVDFGAGKAVIDKVKSAGIPTVFWNRDITKDIAEADLKNLIFFGTQAPQAGVMQGEIAYEKWKNGGDKNGDGKLQYVTLHGGYDNAEAVARTEESIKLFKEKGVEVERLDEKVADWDDTKAKDATDAWIAKYGDKIEVIFANNDGMAIGALNALQQAGFNKLDDKGKVSTDKFIPVYGVDATKQAVAKVKTGELSGTVRQNNETMAKGVIDLIKNKLSGKDWTEGTNYKIFEGDKKSVRMDYEKVQ